METEQNPTQKELLDQLNRAQRDLSVIYEVSNAMRTTLELNHILYIILTGVTSHTGLGFNRAVLFLVNNTERCLELRMAIGPESGEHAQEIWNYIEQHNQDLDDLIVNDKFEKNKYSKLFQSLKHLRFPLGGEEQPSILIEAFHNGQPIHIAKDEIYRFQEDPFLKSFRTQELIIMPLKASDKVKGIIVADNLFTQKPITNDDMKIFQMLSNQAGLAIENSQLYEIVMHQSHTDALTGLWNHGFFQNRLDHEINFHRSKNRPLSLLLIDIDNFKKLNDTYGHQSGDDVLKTMADILKDSSREIDFICRYGGEEFTAILTNTNKEQAYIIAERIRKRIAQRDFRDILFGQQTIVTVSIGLATFPEDASDKEKLIEASDRAMYKAKFSGKNQTFIHQV